MMKDKRTIIVTGAAGGIGSAVAARFAEERARLVLVDCDGGKLAALGEKLAAAGTEALCLPGDLRDMDFVNSIIPAAMDRWKRVDVLVNNAAWRTLETMRTMTPATWNDTLAVCLTAPAFLAKQAAAAMEWRGNGGVILNVASVMATRAGGISPAYIACKGALVSLTYELAVLYGPAGIRVAAVAPGAVATAMSADYTSEGGTDVSSVLTRTMNDHTPLGREAAPEEIAAVLYWLSTPEASYITGTCIEADGGFAHNFHAYRLKQLQKQGEF